MDGNFFVIQDPKELLYSSHVCWRRYATDGSIIAVVSLCTFLCLFFFFFLFMSLRDDTSFKLLFSFFFLIFLSFSLTPLSKAA